MLNFVRKYLGRFPRIQRMTTSLMWKKHMLSDWSNTYLFKSKIVAKTPFGFKLVSRKYIANRLMLQGTFETDEMEVIKTHIQNADVFVDVGANIGLYTCMAKSFGKHVVAIEPQPQNLECLYANLINNNWTDVEVFPIGLSHKPGILTLYGASGPSASLISGWAGYSHHFKKIISVNTMDALLDKRFADKKMFIKIDVEGAEYDVLSGALKTICRYPRPSWFIEICLSEFHPGGGNPNFLSTFELFLKNGYEVRLANTKNISVSLEDIKKWALDKHTTTNEFNYLFTPKENSSR